MKEGEPELADEVLDSRIVDHCRCGDDFCATFYVQPKPEGPYGPKHRNISLEPSQGWCSISWPIESQPSKFFTEMRFGKFFRRLFRNSAALIGTAAVWSVD
jgi:hypothetical protein